MIQSILSNLAIILLGHLFMSMLVSQKSRLSKNIFNTLVVLLFSTVIICMFYLPINIDGFKFDLRLIPLIFLAMFRGWGITLATLTIVCIWRYFMGGIGTVPGIFAGMVGPTLFVLLYYSVKKGTHTHLDRFFILTVCCLISDFPIVFIIPNGWDVFTGFFLIRYTSFIIVGYTYYSFIQAEYKKVYYKNKLEQMAWYDQLTNLFNRKKFIEQIEARQPMPEKNRYIAMIDIDYFKQINDTYGHVAGDDVLIQLAKIFKKQQNDQMIFGRYGGEEFIVYMEAPTLNDAKSTLEELRQIVRDTAFQTEGHPAIHITLSIGLVPLELNSSLTDVIYKADHLLYTAKEQGRDCLVTIS